MVILRTAFLLAAFLYSFFAVAQEVNVAVDIGQNPIYANQPVTGLISITHPAAAKIDPASFKVGGKELKVALVKEVALGDASTLSIFRFETAGKAPGLYLLPSITVTLGDKSYNSPLASYEVKAGGNSSPAQAPSTPTPAAPTSSAGTLQYTKGAPPSEGPKPTLELLAYVKGPSSIYPGQRTTLAYKVSYVGDIDLKEEVLPLLKPEGLRKIGDIDTQEEQSGNASILIVTQLVEAVQPGKFSFGPSVVSGTAYIEGPGGTKAFLNPPLKSEAPPVTVEVLPFPTKGRPAAFNGAIGPITMDVKLTSPATVNVGDKITLAITLKAEGILENLQPPDVCCQPGFSGLFKTNDLPPKTTIQGDTKTFTVDLWPLSKELKAIPPIEYAYFNPKTSEYAVVKSQPIPITVNPAIEPPEKLPASEEKPKMKEGPIKPSPIEIQSIYPLTCRDLHSTWFGTWDVWILIPLGAVLLLIQNSLHEAIVRRRNQVQIKTSQELLQDTEIELNNPKTFFPLLSQTLITWLKEKGEISGDILPEPESLPGTGHAGEVRKFLSKIQEQRFTGKDDLPRHDLLKEAKLIMRNGRNGK